ncbi:MAG: amidohydrolase family protein [Chitinophagaceae bacterium]|nr:amidohydrolase family protein [Chitinophagaceae bacterium]
MQKKLLFLLSCLLCTFSFSQSLLIENISIIDTEKGKLIKNVHVLIKDSVIVNISSKKIQPVSVKTIDGSGKYLIPGLWDMHTHIWSDEFYFPLLIANGVTGVRGMFEDVKNVAAWRKKIADGKINGPVIFSGGPIVDGPQPVWPGSVAVKNPEDGRRAVDSLKNKLHTDFIKVYSLLSRESYFAIAEECKKQNIPFAGHVPNLVTVMEAAKAGQKSMEHLYGMIEAASDSSDYYYRLLQGKITDTTLSSRQQRRKFLLRTYKPENFKRFAKELSQYNSWICPTLTVNKGIAYMNDSTLLDDPRMQYMGVFYRNFWDPRKDFRFKTWTDETFAIQREEFKLKLKLVKELHAAGVKIIAGTDFPNPHCYPGFGIHDELALLVEAGLTPAEALRTATYNAALFFGINNRYGTVAKNKMADLLILDANPLEDISSTKKINSVIFQGKLINKDELKGLLDKAKKMAGQ